LEVGYAILSVFLVFPGAGDRDDLPKYELKAGLLPRTASPGTIKRMSESSLKICFIL
jgi:hypothetical protein